MALVFRVAASRRRLSVMWYICYGIVVILGLWTVALRAAPAQPQIAWMADSYPLTGGSASVSLRWDLWWGDNGDQWRLLQNGTVVHSAALVSNTPNAQNGTRTLTYTTAGTHQLVVELCAGSGAQQTCTASAPKSITIGGGTGGDGDPDWPKPLLEYNLPWINSSNKVVGTYFVEWGVYGRNYHVANIPAQNLTHIMYAFLAICGPNASLQQANPSGWQILQTTCSTRPDFTAVIHDRFAALEKSYPGDQFDNPVRGSFGQLRRLHTALPQVKILASIGGWTLSDPFHYFASDATKRAVFVASVVEFLNAYPFFSGIDIDWEYPGGGGPNGSLGSPQDAASYRLLMGDLRAALNQLGTQNNRHYELTAAVGAAPIRIANVDWANTAQYLDHVFAMTYDYYGGWDNTLGHMAGLRPVPGAIHAGFSAHETAQGLIAAGVPASKVVVGTAMYGRGWTGVTGATTGNPFTGSGNGPHPGTWEAGVLDYRKIESDYRGGATGTGTNGYQAGYDATAEAAWLWNPTSGRLISYDDPRSARAKGAYARTQQLGGVFAWEIDADNGRILNAMHEGLGHSSGSCLDCIFRNGFQATP